MKENKKYNKGHFIGIGIPLGLPLGIPIGVAIGNIPIGLAIGIPIGLIIGIIMELTLNKEGLTIEESGMKDKSIPRAVISIMIGVILLALILFYFIAKY